MEYLILLKNKIHINLKKENKDIDELQIKCEKLNFFKENISNLEMIYNNIKALRIKGSCLPILISIKIEYPNITYYLNNIKTNVEKIKDYLIKAKIDLVYQLDLIYKQNIYLRFLYGNLFKRILKHLNDGDCPFDILRFILNKINNKEDIIDAEIINQEITNNYEEQNKLYNNKTFINISNYIISLFEKNGTSLQKHYEKMLIKSKNKYKGLYLHKCENGESIEEFIINIFFEKIGILPLSQNVLILNKETYLEDIQAFFYRAILCDYNTLFVVGINNLLSNNQRNSIFSFLNSLLSYKNEIFNESEIKDIDIDKTYIYIKSCIVFVYDDIIKDNSFLIELENFNVKEIGNAKKFGTKLKKNYFKNITVITSDICGLGKSYKIKKMIESDKKLYYYFVLGGILTKTIIFEKLSAILSKIKTEKNEDYEKVSIHLDIKESKEISLLNEFLFSFLITKFYINNGNIIYIPNDIQIYIEIPNCFENYLSKFGILKIFNCQNISLDMIPKLDLPNDLINIFSESLLEMNSKEKIENLIKENIGIKKYSYYQVIKFIKLFIYQKKKLVSKLQTNFYGHEIIAEYWEEFFESIKYFTVGGFAKMLTEIYENKNKDYIDLLSNKYGNDFKYEKFCTSLFTIKEKKFFLYIPIKIPDKFINIFKNSEDFLSEVKKALELPNDEKMDVGDKKSLKSILNYKTENFIITEDSFKKMILVFDRIKANIPVIIMGETGCGKTLLIIKLNQILNNGENKVKIINIYPEITENDICKEMIKINKEANHIEDEIWVFFDEINTCQSLSLLTEIFINRTFNGEKVNDNIRLIGACNPYRKRKVGTEKFGLIIDDDNENELVYLVQPLPQSLLYYVLSFGMIDEEDERKYIYNIIEKLFSENEELLHEYISDVILKCHNFLREIYDPSIVSLRDISRFYKFVEFFQKYFSIKDEYLNKDIKGKERLYKIKSIICSIYICYYIKLDNDKRMEFDIKLKEILIKLREDREDIKWRYEELELCLRAEQLSFYLKSEEDFLLDLIEIEKDICINSLLKENVFLLFVSIITKIPLIIIGKSYNEKNLSAQLIYKSLRGKYSIEKFFRKFPSIIQTIFRGSELTNQENIERLFQIAENKYKYFSEKKDIKKEDLPISVIFFDELGLADKSKTNPLNLLYSKLEYPNKNEGISFIGTSNYILSAKINRALVLSVPNLSFDELKITCRNIVKNISEYLIKKQERFFDILTEVYYNYKNKLQLLKDLTVLKALFLANKESKNPIDLEGKNFYDIIRLKKFINLFKKEKKIKVDFHGDNDFFNFIKEIALEMKRLYTFEEYGVIEILEKSIERNFGGIDYEIDIDFLLELNNIKDIIDDVKHIFEDFIWEKRRNDVYDEKIKNIKIKFSSIFLFKRLLSFRDLFIIENNQKIRLYYRHDLNNLNRCIIDNINKTNNFGYLLLEINPFLSSLIYKNIKNQNPHKEIVFYDGSPFIDDNNMDYYCKIINKIQDDAQADKLIILQNLNLIQPFLYDLYNKNYIIKDEQKYSRIFLDNFNFNLVPIHDLLRIIILVDRNFVDEKYIKLLNRFKKIKIIFDKLLDDEQKMLVEIIIKEINLKKFIEKKRINYALKDLLINCGEEEIGGMIYNIYLNYKKEGKEIKKGEIKQKVYSIIAKMLCQDIICILPENNVIKRKYYEEKKYYNFKQYITDDVNKSYKISVIYTFNSITNDIKGANNEMKCIIAEIKSENALKYMIDEIININENSQILKEYNIIIHFEQIDLNKIQFVRNFIDKYYREGKYEKYKFIFIVHIERNFSLINKEVYSIIDINEDVNQLFIDNLNAPDINLKDIMERDIINIIENQFFDLNKEFNRVLTKFIYKEINMENDDNNCLNLDKNNYKDGGKYISEIKKYMNEETDFKNDIILKAIKLINNDEGVNENCKLLIDKLLQMNHICKNSLDIISCILDYIKEEIFNKYLEYIFEVLEGNNILTNLKDIKSNNNNILNESILKKIKKSILDRIDNKNYRPKFLPNYNIPGFYNLYKNLSKFINKNIAKEYSKNERKLRKTKLINEKKIKSFHENEETLISSVYDEISSDKYIFDFIDEIPNELILKDYINYFVNKYSNIINSKEYFNKKIIEILLNLRFNENKNKIIKNNKKESIKILIKKIIWMEANINYIPNLSKLFEYSKDIFNEEDKLYIIFEEKIIDKNKSISYIIDKNKEYSEVNECYYIFLVCFCLCILSEDINLTKFLSLESNEKDKIQDEKEEINKYINKLKKINIILKELNNNLKLNINEISIIDKIINLQNLRKINIEKIIEIIKNKDKNQVKDKTNKKKERIDESDSDSESSNEDEKKKKRNKVENYNESSSEDSKSKNKDDSSNESCSSSEKRRSYKSSNYSKSRRSSSEKSRSNESSNYSKSRRSSSEKSQSKSRSNKKSRSNESSNYSKKSRSKDSSSSKKSHSYEKSLSD